MCRLLSEEKAMKSYSLIKGIISWFFSNLIFAIVQIIAAHAAVVVVIQVMPIFYLFQFVPFLFI